MAKVTKVTEVLPLLRGVRPTAGQAVSVKDGWIVQYDPLRPARVVDGFPDSGASVVAQIPGIRQTVDVRVAAPITRGMVLVPDRRSGLWVEERDTFEPIAVVAMQGTSSPDDIRFRIPATFVRVPDLGIAAAEAALEVAEQAAGFAPYGVVPIRVEEAAKRMRESQSADGARRRVNQPFSDSLSATFREEYPKGFGSTDLVMWQDAVANPTFRQPEEVPERKPVRAPEPTRVIADPQKPRRKFKLGKE